jgi:hypothetical protein
MALKQVTSEQFFKVVGPIDSIPKVDVNTFKDRLHVSHWEVQHTRKYLGLCKSDSWGILPTEFYLVAP